MPTYEYECTKCKKTFEAFQSMKDDAYKTCPKEKCCMKTWGKGKVKRLIGAGAGLIFKGSGFYITDYRSEGYKSAAKSDSKSESPTAKPADNSSAPSRADKGETAAPKAETKKPFATEAGKERKSTPKKS
ncbi:MAG: FmdB family zinc ribbon protein [Verrucomicrobiota bacterium]